MKHLIDRYISINPSVCHGKPVIKGTRILVATILELLESGMPIKEILRGFPSLNEQAVKAAIHYAIVRIQEEEFVSVG